MTDKIIITNENSQSVEAEKVSAFEIADFGRNYVIYTFNDVDPNGLSKLHVCQYTEENGLVTLRGVETPEEWTRIKDVMRSLINGNNVGFTYKNIGDSVSINSSTSAKLIAVKSDAVTKMRENYNNNVAKQQAPVQTPVVEQPIETMEMPETPVAPEPLVSTPTTNVAGVNFQNPPAELNNIPIEPVVPTNETIAPLTINEQQTPVEPTPVENVIPTINVPTQNTQTPVSNILSKEELLKEVSDLLDRSEIRYDVVKEQILLSIKVGLNNYELIKHIEDQKIETADIAKTTVEINKVNQQMVNQQPTNINNGPTLSYQQTA